MKKPTIFLVIFGLLSCLSTMWISDEFDDLRSIAYAFYAIPVSILFIYSFRESEHFWLKHPMAYRFLFASTALIFLWGHVLFINAILPSKNVVMSKVFKTENNDRGLYHSYKRGGLGFYYRTRF